MPPWGLIEIAFNLSYFFFRRSPFEYVSLIISSARNSTAVSDRTPPVDPSPP